MQKSLLPCDIMLWITFGLEWKLMSVFACVIFEEGELPEGGI